MLSEQGALLNALVSVIRIVYGAEIESNPAARGELRDAIKRGLRSALDDIEESIAVSRSERCTH